MPQIVPPVPSTEEDHTASVWTQFFQELRRMANQPVFYASTADPGPSDAVLGGPDFH